MLLIMQALEARPPARGGGQALIHCPVEGNASSGAHTSLGEAFLTTISAGIVLGVKFWVGLIVLSAMLPAPRVTKGVPSEV